MRAVTAARTYFAAGCALVAIYFVLPAGAQPTLYDVIGGSAVAAILLGTYRYRPRWWLAWVLFAAGNGFFVLGDILSGVQGDVTPPTVSDGFYLTGYPVIAAGLVLLMLSAAG